MINMEKIYYSKILMMIIIINNNKKLKILKKLQIAFRVLYLKQARENIKHLNLILQQNIFSYLNRNGTSKHLALCASLQSIKPFICKCRKHEIQGFIPGPVKIFFLKCQWQQLYILRLKVYFIIISIRLHVQYLINLRFFIYNFFFKKGFLKYQTADTRR